MGFMNKIFQGRDSESKTTVRQYKSDNEKIGADKVRFLDGGRHVHSSYKLNTTTGDYEEHHGGENSPDRSYNK